MKTSKTTLVLYFLCAIGVVALVARFFSTPPTTVDRTAAVPGAPKSVGGGGDPKPGSVVRSAKALKLDKSTNVIPDLDKEARSRDLTAKEALESKFRNWRDDGRRQFEEIFQGDRERTGLVMRALFQKEEFRGMFQQSRELEAKWPKATDDEKAVQKRNEEWREERRALQNKVSATLTLLPPILFMLFGIVRWRRREANRANVKLAA